MSVSLKHGYEGRTIKGWPITTPVRGEVVAAGGEFVGAAGKGRFLKCDISPATALLGRPTIGFDPETGLAGQEALEHST